MPEIIATTCTTRKIAGVKYERTAINLVTIFEIQYAKRTQASDSEICIVNIGDVTMPTMMTRSMYTTMQYAKNENLFDSNFPIEVSLIYLLLVAYLSSGPKCVLFYMLSIAITKINLKRRESKYSVMIFSVKTFGMDDSGR